MNDETADPRHRVPVGARLLAVLALCFRAGLSALLVGRTGIGKSEVLRQLSDRLGIGFLVLDPTVLEPTDLVGFPFIANGRTCYAPPGLLPSEGRGIIVVEELGRAELPMRQPLLQLLTTGKLHDYTLPEGWRVFATTNPADDEYDVQQLDPALRARFLEVEVTTDLSCWTTWARANGIHPAILRLASLHDGILEEVPPRTWSYVSRALGAMEPGQLEDHALLRDVLAGYLTLPWLELLLQDPLRLETDPAVDLYGLLASYGSDPSLRTTIVGLREEGRTDILDRVCRRLEAILEGATLGQLAGEGLLDLGSLERLFEDLPGDQRERLQRAFGSNPVSAELIGLEAEAVLHDYPGSAAEKQVRSWLEQPTLAHRVLSLVHSLTRHMKGLRNIQPYRRDRSKLRSLNHFVTQVGATTAAPLIGVLEDRKVRRRSSP